MRFSLPVLALLFLGGCSEVCIRHSDCGAGLQCRGGQCLPPEADLSTPPDLGIPPDLSTPEEFAVPPDLTPDGAAD